MLENAVITLFNESEGKFYPTVFENVSLRGKTQNSITSNGLVTVNTKIIRIPEGKETKPYLPFKDWQKLADDKKADFWTLQGDNKDYVAETAITSFESFTELCKNYNILRVYSFADNRGEILSHWRIDAK